MDEAVNRSDGGRSYLIRTDQCLGEGADRQDELVAPARAELGNCSFVMRIGAIKESDNDPSIDDDQRHSRRSFLRYPLGYMPVRLPA